MITKLDLVVGEMRFIVCVKHPLFIISILNIRKMKIFFYENNTCTMDILMSGVCPVLLISSYQLCCVHYIASSYTKM